jgi:TonB family protein
MLQQLKKHRQTLLIIAIAMITCSISDIARAQNVLKTTTQQDTTKDVIDSNGVYKRAKTTPQFPGGEQAMLRFIMKKLKYPKIGKDAVYEGLVKVRFVISKTGQVKDVKVVKSLSPSFDQEAIRVISKLPDWTPAKNEQGEDVDMYFQIPISFKMG